MTKIKHCLQRLTEFPGFWLGLLALMILFPIIGKQEFWTGYDTYFHMNTIYEDAMQIKTGHFSYFLSMFGFERSGRIVNSLYGPFFSYFCGALLLLCHSWVNFEFVLFFATMVISGYGAYRCARLLKINKNYAVVAGMLYMLSRPIVVMWIGNFEFTGLGAAILLPFVLMIGIKIYQQRKIKVLPLAVIMSLCLQVHLITSLIAVMVLIPLVFFGFIQSSKKLKMISHGLIAAVLTFCLSGNIFGAIYELYSSNTLIPTFPNFNLQTTKGTKTISLHGYTITDLGRLYTLLLLIVGLLFLLRLIFDHRSIEGLDWVLLFEDGLFLWMSSTYFPWDQFVKYIPKLSIIIQFPSRFVAISFLLTLLLMVRLLQFPVSHSKLNLMVDIFLIAVFICALKPAFGKVRQLSNDWQSNGVVKYWTRPTKNGGFRYAYKSNRIRAAIRNYNISDGINVVHKVTPDYMPTTSKMNIYNYYRWPINPTYIKDFRNQVKYHKFTKDHVLVMTWQNRGNQRLQVPLVKYGNTIVMLNHHRIHPSTSIIGTMNVQPRNGQNVMSIKYQPGHMFKVLSMLCIITWLLLIVCLVIKIM